MKSSLEVKERSHAEVKVNSDALATHEFESMCRILVNCVNRYFEDPQVKAEYEQWKRERIKTA